MTEALRNDIFEPGDLTALICIDQPDEQQMIADQLSSIDYKIHVSVELDDAASRMQAFPYDVIALGETFQGASMEENQLLLHAIYLPSDQRRNQFLVLVGPHLETNDEMVAFIYSVDLVFNSSDLSSIKPILRRGVARQKEFYHAFNECMHKVKFGRKLSDH